MPWSKVFLIITLIYLGGFLAHALLLGKTVYGDGIYYYSWLRSGVVDGDIDFTNDYAFFGASLQLTPTGLLGNIYPVGPALVWLPSFLLSHRLLNGTGVGLPYQLTVGVVSVASGLVGLIILEKLLRQFFDQTIAITTTLAIAFATNLFFYSSVDPVNSHALSFLGSALFLTLLLQKPFQPFLLGLVLGILALIRPQDAILGILLIPYLSLPSLLPLGLGAFLSFLPQLLAWLVLYGKIASPYLSRGYGFNFWQPHLLEVLFSTNNGLILWTPILALALGGFFLAGFPRYLNRLICLLTIAAQIYLVASWTTWWQGESYSGRMFVSLLPVFALGLANLFKFLSRLLLPPIVYLGGLVAPLSLINISLIFFFLLSH